MTSMHQVFIILGITTISFLIPKFRSDLVALISLLALYITGIINLQEAFAGFSNSVVIMIAALFIVGEGVFQTGLAERLGNGIVKITGNSELRMTVILLIFVALFSGFMSNTGTIAIMLPVVVSLCRKLQVHPGKVLMPLAFASSIGGTFTLIGTAPNLLADESLQNFGSEGLSFFAFTPIAIIVFLASIVYIWFVARKILDKPLENQLMESEDAQINNLVEQYNISENIYYIKVEKNSRLIGKNLKELALDDNYGVKVLEGKKVVKNKKLGISYNKGSSWITAAKDYIVEIEDILVVFCEKKDLEIFARNAGIKVVEEEKREGAILDRTQLAELILTPRSKFTDKNLKEANFKSKYGLTVIGIKHQYQQGRMINQQDEFNYGDSLLVHGKTKDIEALSREKQDIVVLGYIENNEVSESSKGKSILAGMILLLMVLFMIFEVFSAAMTVILAATAMVLTKCIKQTDQAYKSISWSTIILIACMLPMATALENTKGINFISEKLISTLGGAGPIAVMAGLYITASIFSQFISNTATAVLLYPVAIMTAQQLGVNPVPMVMAVAFSASMAFATPVATPPNAMVMGAGKYSFGDFLKVGAPLQILIAIIVILLLPLFYPF